MFDDLGEWGLLAARWPHGGALRERSRPGTATPGVDPQPGGRRTEGGRSDDVTAFPESTCEVSQESIRSISGEITAVSG
jgi:hypothetical protein